MAVAAIYVWFGTNAVRLPTHPLSRQRSAINQWTWANGWPGKWSARVEEAEIRARIEMLRQDHRDLDAAIEALRGLPMPDMIQLQRFKKKKLRLKDEIMMLEDQLIPDIIA